MFCQCSRQLARMFVVTPFDVQPIPIPTPRTYGATVESIFPAGDRSREVAVALLLKELPVACNRAKEQHLRSKYAASYYRRRFGSGMEAQKMHVRKVLNYGEEGDGDAKARTWARSLCIPVEDPLNP